MNHLVNQYKATAAGLYLNYFIHGIQTVILAQGAGFFAQRWQVTQSSVFGIIAAIGIGKMIVMLFSGVLSDYWGRKPFVIGGIIGYLIFFGGLLFCTNGSTAFVLALIAGGATSLLDGGTYPALLEIYPKQASVATLRVKGFIAIASALVPLVVSFLNAWQYSFYWLVFLAFVLTCISLLFMLPQKFPPQQRSQQPGQLPLALVKPTFAVEGMLCLAFGFLCLGTFYLWQQSVTKFAIDIVGMSDLSARGLGLVFSLSTILGVFVTALIMQKGIKDITILVWYTFISTLALLLAYQFMQGWSLYIASFVLGFFMAGGLLQLGGALLSQFFPNHKGRNTSMYNVSFALASFVMPFMIKILLEQQKFNQLPLIAAIGAALSFAAAFLLLLRYRRVFGGAVSVAMGE